MTATLERTAAPDVWAIGAPRLLAALDTDHAGHLRAHGPLPAADLDRLLALLDAARLTGRGGAGFPLAAKLRSLSGTARRVVVNGTESEPGSWKDRTLLRRAPHLVLDGALVTARATGARAVTVAVHDAVTAERVRIAAAQRGARVDVRVLAGGFVAGEARAVVRALGGDPALPPGRRTPPSADGTLLSNAETFAQLAVLLRLGPSRFASTGTAAEPGTALVTVGGAVGRPGVVELPLGTPLGIVLAAASAAPAPQAVVLGGYHGAWLAPDPQLRLSREGTAGRFGAGVLLVLDDATCALGELARVSGWLAAQSARQCGPCRFGLPALAADVAALAAGRGAAVARHAIERGGASSLVPAERLSVIGGKAAEHAAAVTGRGACAHPDGTARFVLSGLALLQGELATHAARGTCGRPVLGQLPVLGRPTVLAPQGGQR